MKHGEFEIGKVFWCADERWRTTDIGTRTIVAIPFGDLVTAVWDEVLSHEDAETKGWFRGPPYLVQETVFDEFDIKVCSEEQ